MVSPFFPLKGSHHRQLTDLQDYDSYGITVHTFSSITTLQSLPARSTQT